MTWKEQVQKKLVYRLRVATLPAPDITDLR